MGTNNEIDNAGTALYNAYTGSEVSKLEDDSIEFGDGVVQTDVVSFEKNSSEEQPKVAQEEVIVPVSHSGEGTLLCGSAQLDLLEELEGEKPKPKQYHGLIITLIVLIILSIISSLVYFLVIQKDLTATEESDIEQEIDSGKRQIKRSFQQCQYVTKPFADSVLVNGVPPKLSDGYNKLSVKGEIPLIENEENMLTFFEVDSVPLNVIIEKDRDFDDNPIEYVLMDGEVYRESTISIKPPSNMDLSNGIYYLNGVKTKAAHELEVKALSGMPYFIHVHQKDMGDHLEIIWPTKTREEVELPPLELLSNAERSTQLDIKVPKEYLNDDSFVLKVFAENEYTHKPGKRIIEKGELIKIDLSKDNREPLKMVLDSTPFGSISIDSYLKISTQTYAMVKFDRESPRDVTVCFRRTGESLCTEIGKNENPVPSGTWEIKAYRMVDGKIDWFDNAPYEEIKANTQYTLSVRIKGNKFELGMNQKSKKSHRSRGR